ncbi:MAG: enoyl-CoA hydratase [Rhizobium sp.]|nr:enoyl-CoA hydratase [Rhizobium sp.]
MAHFDIDRSDGIARITFTRPEKHNAFDEVLIGDLTRTLVGLGLDRSINAVVLAAQGKSFSAGGDLDWMKRAAEKSRAGNIADAEALAGLMHTLYTLPKTTLAIVQGPAYGGGVGLVACCDIAIAGENASFALSEVNLGLIPAAISPYVIAAIGPRQARRYFQTAEVFDAAEAQRIGLVHEVVAADGLEERAAEILAAIARTAPVARQDAKQLVSDVAYRDIDDTLTGMTAERIADARARDEAGEGLTAFFERRPALWPRKG